MVFICCLVGQRCRSWKTIGQGPQSECRSCRWLVWTVCCSITLSLLHYNCDKSTPHRSSYEHILKLTAVFLFSPGTQRCSNSLACPKRRQNAPLRQRPASMGLHGRHSSCFSRHASHRRRSLPLLKRHVDIWERGRRAG